MSQYYASYPHLLHPPATTRSSSTSNSRQASHSQLGMSQTPSASTSTMGLGGKLRNMLDRQKFALFQVDVTLHELGNVPQLEGDFAVRWRFRGKRPKTRDAVHRLDGHLHGHGHGTSTPGVGPGVASSVAPSPKPSLPNLKLTQATYAGSLHPSSSSVSLRSTSTGGSSSIRSGQSGLPTASHGVKGKSMSTPPLPMTSMSSNGRVEKKGSDPTPLRQSVKVEPNLETVVSQGDTVESPPPLDSASSTSYLPSPIDHDTPTASSSRVPSRGSSLPPTHPLSTANTPSQRSLLPSAPSSSTSQLPPTHPLATASSSTARSLQPSPSASSTLVGLSTGPPSASSSTSHLSVPPPNGRAGSSTPVPLERTGSQQTTSAHSAHSGNSAQSQASLGVRNGDRPTPRRVRSISGASFNSVHQPMGKGKSIPLSARRGVTPSRPLKSHMCTWDHDLQLALRIPISKERSATAAPGTKSRAPLLGEGSESDSGLHLIIEQLPSASTTSPAHSKSSDPALADQVHAAGKSHHVPHSPEKRGERTVFGKVDIDLAAFAGRGKTTRKFLLGGSRTNATVKLTVDMTWIGGDGNWVAPPLQEGHHVATQLKDVTGGRDAGQDLQRDLALVKTPSASSTDSSISQTHSSKSRNASSLNLARQPSATISQPRPQYKTYDHHLLSPDSATTRMPQPTDRDKTQNASDKSKGASSSSPTRSMFSPQWNHRPQHYHHHHHRHSHRAKLTQGITELSPEAVIEHIFNPYESHEESPFTFVPPPRPTSEVDLAPPLRDDEEHHEHAPAAQEQEQRQHRLAGWRRRRDQRKDMMGRTASGISVVMGAAVGSGGGALHAHPMMTTASGDPSRRTGGASTPVPAS